MFNPFILFASSLLLFSNSSFGFVHVNYGGSEPLSQLLQTSKGGLVQSLYKEGSFLQSWNRYGQLLWTTVLPGKVDPHSSGDCESSDREKRPYHYKKLHKGPFDTIYQLHNARLIKVNLTSGRVLWDKGLANFGVDQSCIKRKKIIEVDSEGIYLVDTTSTVRKVDHSGRTVWTRKVAQPNRIDASYPGPDGTIWNLIRYFPKSYRGDKFGWLFLDKKTGKEKEGIRFFDSPAMKNFPSNPTISQAPFESHDLKVFALRFPNDWTPNVGGLVHVLDSKTGVQSTHWEMGFEPVGQPTVRSDRSTIQLYRRTSRKDETRVITYSPDGTRLWSHQLAGFFAYDEPLIFSHGDRYLWIPGILGKEAHLFVFDTDLLKVVWNFRLANDVGKWRSVPHRGVFLPMGFTKDGALLSVQGDLLNKRIVAQRHVFNPKGLKRGKTELLFSYDPEGEQLLDARWSEDRSYWILEFSTGIRTVPVPKF